jgi:hypothetical protein
VSRELAELGNSGHQRRVLLRLGVRHLAGQPCHPEAPMSQRELVDVVRACKGNGGKVRREVERRMGWHRGKFGETAEWYRAWEQDLAGRVAAAYAEVFS